MELCYEHQLKNGLKTLFIPSKQAPVIAVQAWIQYGAADESDKEAGLAHFFEHLLFKGTKKRQVGQIAREVESIGGDINAFTSYDHTVMHMTLGSQHLAQALDILSDSLINTILDPDEINKEREVVIEEMKRRHDSPSSIAGDLLRERLFAGHPYSRPVIGFEDVLKKITRDELLKAYQRRYVTDNIFLVVAGDFEAKRAEAEVEKSFSSMSSQKHSHGQRKTEYGKNEKLLLHPFKTENIITHLAWKGTEIGNESDVAALDVLSFIMGQSESSRLIKKLVLDDNLVDSIGMGSWTPKNTGSIDISFRASPKSAQKIPRILKEIQNCFNRPIDDNELERAKKNMLSSLIYSKESVDGLAQRFAAMKSLTGSWERDLTYYEEVKRLEVSDLNRVYEKYINWNEASLIGIYPENISAPKLSSSLFDKSPKPSSKKLKTHKPNVEKWNFNGLTILHKEVKHLPICSLRWAGLGGQRIESSAKMGTGSLWSKVVDTGSENYRGKKIDRHGVNLLLDQASASISTFHGRNSWGWQLDSMSEDFESLFELMSALKEYPSFNKSEFDLEKKYQKQQIKSQKDSSTSILYQIFHQKLFGKHPFSFQSRGTLETLEKVKVQDLVKYNKQQESQKQVLSIVGNISRDKLSRILDEHLGKKKFSKNESLLKRKAPKNPAGPMSVFENADKAQTHILLGFPTDGIFNKDHYSLVAMTALLSGQGGRLFLELRDKLSLCYSVGPTLLEGIDGGYFGFYIGTSPDKKELALKSIWTEIEKLKNNLAPEEEWNRALNFYSGHHLIEQQHFSAQAMGMALDELYGKGFENYFNYTQNLMKCSAKDVQRVAQKYFSKPYVLAEVGPK